MSSLRSAVVRALVWSGVLAIVVSVWIHSRENLHSLVFCGPGGQINMLRVYSGKADLIVSRSDLGAARAWTVMHVRDDHHGMIESESDFYTGSRTVADAPPSTKPVIRVVSTMGMLLAYPTHTLPHGSPTLAGFALATYPASPLSSGRDTLHLGTPLWFWTMLATLVLGRQSVKTIRIWRRQRSGRCLACGYDLRATPERCPECGAVATHPGVRGPSHAGV